MIHWTTSRRTNPITANVAKEMRLSLQPTNSPVTALKITIEMAIRLAAIATPDGDVVLLDLVVDVVGGDDLVEERVENEHDHAQEEEGRPSE